jgi:hypothetical protein
MPETPKRHFDSDIGRAKSLIKHAKIMECSTPEERLLRDDVCRSAWMFAVGAMDAYFCDAYVHYVTTTIRAKSIQSNVSLPAFIKNIRIPVGSILSAYANRPNWKWRMAVREMMEKDNVLQLEKITKLFNPFLPENSNKKLFGEILTSWIHLQGATSHLFGYTSAQFSAIPEAGKNSAIKIAKKTFNSRFEAIIQRRHDCIHNCDRPRSSPLPLGRPGSVRNVIRDVNFLVTHFDTHIEAEFPLFLTRIGCSPVTRNRLGY